MSKNLVLLPGWTRREKSYQGLINSCPKDKKIIVISYERIIPEGHIEDFLVNFKNFLDQRGLKKISLIGHSLGGALALEFTLKYPHMIERLYLVDSAGVYGREDFFQLSNNVLKNLFSSGSTKIRSFLKNSPQFISKLKMHARLGHYAFRIDLQDHGHKIQTPTIILWGDKDILTPLWQGRKLHQAIPNSSLVILPNEPHDWLVYSPQLFWRNIV